MRLRTSSPPRDHWWWREATRGSEKNRHKNQLNDFLASNGVEATGTELQPWLTLTSVITTGYSWWKSLTDGDDWDRPMGHEAEGV